MPRFVFKLGNHGLTKDAGKPGHVRNCSQLAGRLTVDAIDLDAALKKANAVVGKRAVAALPQGVSVTVTIGGAGVTKRDLVTGRKTTLKNMVRK